MSSTTEVLRRISYTYQDQCGEQLYMYTTRPTEREDHYVFNNETIVGAAKAEKYANDMLAKVNRRPAAELVFEEDFPGAKRARVRQHTNTVSAAIVSPVGDYVVESELFIDVDQAREWINKKAKEYTRG